MQPVKKQVEILLMHYFRECYNDFPSGRVNPSESPDFVVILKSKNCVGIELTRLNPLNAKEPDEDERNNLQIRERIIETARTFYESHSPLKLFVKFLFSDTMAISRERELSVSVRLAHLIRAITDRRTNLHFFSELIDAGQLPEGVEAVLIVHHPILEVSVWERSNNLGISENIVADLREAIRKKDEKLRLYQKQHLNYYWLLITTDRLRGVRNYNLFNKIMNHSFQSGFQHVFLFDLVKSEVFQLV